jgi:hypothetical protein
MIKIALIWGNHREDKLYTTHHTFWEATLAERPDIQYTRYTWSEWQQMPRDFDLYLFIDWHPSLYKLHASIYHPRVLYWWDAFHHSFVYLSGIIEQFDKCYLAEYSTVQGLKAQGYDNVAWLSSAFYPKLYRPLNLSKVHDYGFIGQLDNVVTRYGITRWEFIQRLNTVKGLHGYVGSGVYGETVNQIYNESKILFDWTIGNNLGTRFFEGIGSGGLLLMNKCQSNGIEQVAKEGTHYVGYDGSFEDFEEKLKYYLEHEKERQDIATAGCAYFLNRHTYNHRLNVILDDFNLRNQEPFDQHQEKLPVYINNFNRLTYMLKLIQWLEQIPYVEIIILDNNSTYQPLLEWYKTTKHEVIYLGKNVGHHALWEHRSNKQIPYQRLGDWFVYTDADVVPREDCPLDVFKYLRQIMLRNRDVTKVGLGIEIEDIPDHYPLKGQVQSWEHQYWAEDKLISPNLYRVNTDTTMALYNKHRVSFTNLQNPPPHVRDVPDYAIRTGYPYIIRHLPWYVDANNLTDEEKFFMENAAWMSTWSNILKKHLLKTT